LGQIPKKTCLQQGGSGKLLPYVSHSSKIVDLFTMLVAQPSRKMPDSPTACCGDEWHYAFFVKVFGVSPLKLPKKELANLGLKGAKPLWVKKIACFCEAGMRRCLQRG
jgi:hypothetical protein